MIVGAGVVGTASGRGLASVGHRVTFVDVDRRRVEALRAEGFDACEAVELQDEPTFVFLSLPTPSTSSGYELSALTSGVSAVGAALASSAAVHTVVLRSTTAPGTCDQLIRPVLEATSGKLEGEGFRLAANPEFLRAATALEDFLSPWVTVIGSHSDETTRQLVELFEPFGGQIATFSTTMEAELVKCAHNIFNAAKISFWNEMWGVAQRLGIDGDRVAATVAMSAEGSINPQYGIRGGAPYGGACLPKDTVGFLGFATDLGIPTPLLEAVIEVNDAMARSVRDELREVTENVELLEDDIDLTDSRPSTVRRSPSQLLDGRGD